MNETDTSHMVAGLVATSRRVGLLEDRAMHQESQLRVNEPWSKLFLMITLAEWLQISWLQKSEIYWRFFSNVLCSRASGPENAEDLRGGFNGPSTVRRAAFGGQVSASGEQRREVSVAWPRQNHNGAGPPVATTNGRCEVGCNAPWSNPLNVSVVLVTFPSNHVFSEMRPWDENGTLTSLQSPVEDGLHSP